MIGPTPSGPFGSLALGASPVQLLDDRLRMNFPACVRFAQRNIGGFMGMDVSRRRETQAWISVPAPWGAARLLIEVIDPFALVGDSILNLGLRCMQDLSVSLRCRCSVDPTGVGDRCLLLSATSLAQNRTDIVVAQGLCPHPDGTLLLVNFITDAATARNAEADTFAFVRALAATLHAGARPLERAARVQQLGPADRPGALALALPEGFVWDTDRGPDFVVHTFSQVCPSGVDRLAFKIYLGEHPCRSTAPGAKARSVPGQILGQGVEWRVVEDRETWAQEVIVRVPSVDERLYLHAFGSVTSEAQAATVRGLLATLRIATGDASSHVATLALDGRLTYEYGAEYGTFSEGLVRLEIEAHGRLRATRKRAGRTETWSAQVDAATHGEILRALRASPFPGGGHAGGPVPVGTVFRTLRLEAVSLDVSVEVPFAEGFSPPWAEVFRHLDALARKITGHEPDARTVSSHASTPHASAARPSAVAAPEFVRVESGPLGTRVIELRTRVSFVVPDAVTVLPGRRGQSGQVAFDVALRCRSHPIELRLRVDDLDTWPSQQLAGTICRTYAMNRTVGQFSVGLGAPEKLSAWGVDAAASALYPLREPEDGFDYEECFYLIKGPRAQALVFTRRLDSQRVTPQLWNDFIGRLNATLCWGAVREPSASVASFFVDASMNLQRNSLEPSKKVPPLASSFIRTGSARRDGG